MKIYPFGDRILLNHEAAAPVFHTVITRFRAKE